MAESSVRVEVGDGGHSGDSLDPPAPPERSGRGPIVAVVVLALVAVGAAVFLLRPDAGEAADGSQRQATTTTTTTVAESEAVDELDTPIPDGLEVVRVEGLGGSVSSFGFDIVRGPDGQYYGSPNFVGDGASDVPEIYLSLNGQNWIQVETQILGETDGSTDGVINDEFANFHARPGGFGVIRTRLAPISQGFEPAQIDLLTSSNGAEWVLDVNLFLADEAADFAFPAVIDGEPLLAAPVDHVGIGILEQAGLTTNIADVCFVGTSADLITVLGCDGDEGIISPPEGDTRAFDAAHACLNQVLTAGLGPSFEFGLPQSGDPTPFSTNRQIAGVPIRLSDGRLVSFVEQAQDPLRGCEDFSDLFPEAGPRGIAIWDGPGEAEIVNIDPDPGEFQSGRRGAQPVVVDGQLWAIAEGGLWKIDLDGTSELETPVDGALELGTNTVDLSTFGPNTAILTQVVDGVLIQHFVNPRLGGPARVQRQLAVARPDFSAQDFLYVDGDVVIFLDDRGVLQSVQFPNGQLPGPS